MVEPLPCSEAHGRASEQPFSGEQSFPEDPNLASEYITEQIGRLIPLVNGRRRVARIDSGAELSGLPSLLSWDADGQLSID